MSEESVRYEKFVRKITETLLRAQGLDTVKVEHNIQVQGLSRSHQVDVYWQYKFGGVLHRVVINCKRYGRPVEVTDVLTLNGVLADMPGVRGVIVTTSGYQQGAVDYATAHGIGLKVIREPEDEDYGDRIREMRGVVQPHYYEALGLNVGVDTAWTAANLTPEQAAKWSGRVVFRDVVIENVADGTTLDLNSAYRTAIGAHGRSEVGAPTSHVLRFDDAFISMPGFARTKLRELSFSWIVRRGTDVEFGVRFDAEAIVRDAIAGTLLFVSPEGIVSGDVEDELGPRRA